MGFWEFGNVRTALGNMRIVASQKASRRHSADQLSRGKAATQIFPKAFCTVWVRVASKVPMGNF